MTKVKRFIGRALCSRIVALAAAAVATGSIACNTTDAAGPDEDIRPTGEWRFVAGESRWSLYRADADAEGSQCWAFESSDARPLPEGLETVPELAYQGKEFVCFEDLRLSKEPEHAAYIPFVNRQSLAGFVTVGVASIEIKLADGGTVVPSSGSGWFATFLPQPDTVKSVLLTFGAGRVLTCEPMAGASALLCHGDLRGR